MKKLLYLCLIVLLPFLAAAQPAVKGYRYEKNIKRTDVEFSRFDSAGKKVYLIWRKDVAPHVYPNPTTGFVYLSDYGNATVTDMLGRVVRKEFNTDKLNLTSLRPGTYFINFTIHNSPFTHHHLEVKL